MKKYIKRYFNMVEIALAMAIIGIGISSVLVLFPVGLTASRDSIAENNLANIAEFVITFIKASEVANGEVNSFAENPMNIPSTKVTADKIDWENDTTTELSSGFKLHSSGVMKFEQSTTLANGDTVVDFDAEIRVWEENPNMYMINLNYINAENVGAKPEKVKSADYQEYGNSLSIYSGSNINRLFLKVYMVEISWPVNYTYANREKRTFRYEIFNENFQSTSATPTP